MAIINFSIPATLENQIQSVVRLRGFASKAEFFRFTVIKYLDEIRDELSSIKTENNYTLKQEKEMLVATDEALKYGRRHKTIKEAHNDALKR